MTFPPSTPLCAAARASPCAIVKGDHQGSYHAWNMVYVDGQWSPVDLTKAIANRDVDVTDFSQCVLTQEGYTAAAF